MHLVTFAASQACKFLDLPGSSGFSFLLSLMSLLFPPGRSISIPRR